MIDKYGADTVRLFTMFAAPPEQSLEWNDDAIAGASRFLKRVWALFDNHRDSLLGRSLAPLDKPDLADAKELKAIRMASYSAVDRAVRDYERQQYNTVIAAAMELTNALEKVDVQALASQYSEQALEVFAEACGVLLKILYPVAPHICEHLWAECSNGDNIVDAGWLKLDESALIKDEITYVIQVNGKLRARIDVPASLPKEEIEKLALQDEHAAKFIDGKTVRKVIVVPNKLVNIVAN